MHAAPAPGPDKSGPRRRRKSTSADIVAATVALQAALPAGLLERFGCGQPATLVVQVPAASWCVPVDRAFFDLLEETKPAGGSPRHDICKFVRDGSLPREQRPTTGNEEVVKGISKRESVVGISPEPKKFLPQTLSAAPDFHVVVRPLTGAQVQAVIADVTGARARKALADELVAGLDLADLAVAVRPGSTAADCEARLRRLAAARTVTIGDDVPLLQDLSGCDAAKEWGLGLAQDIALYRQGRIGWGDVAEVGAILVGPPGVGKTQLAKSLARTLDVPLVMTSYAAWQSHRDGHLGDLVSEMRRSAAEALSRAPCIWFVDEADSLPNRNDADLRYREWYVAVVNAMLEVAERSARPGVILLGACNDASRMDAALMRPGRFGDRIIEIPRPDENALVGIMRHHLRADLAHVDLLRFARTALGTTGADVAAWVRGARRLARNAGRDMSPDDLMKQIVPDDDRSEADMRRAAFHEAGHCVATVVLTEHRVGFVSILRAADSGGQTSAAPLGTDFPTRADLEKRITILLSGRAAEEVLVGTPSAASGGGPHSDLARATDVVVGMHAAWGMGKAPVAHAQFRKASALLRADAALRRAVADDMARIYRRALRLITDHAGVVRLLADALMVARHLDGDEIDRICGSAGLRPTRRPPVPAAAPGGGAPGPAADADGAVVGPAAATHTRRPAAGRKPDDRKPRSRRPKP